MTTRRDSTSPTTAPGSRAGPRSPACAPSRASSRRRWRRSCGEPVRLTVAGRTDAGRPRPGPGGELRPRRPSRRRSSPGAQRRHRPHDIAVIAAAAGGRRLRRPPRRPLADLLLPGPGRADAEPLRARAGAVWPHRLDREALDACAARRRRHPRLHRLHPDPDRARPLRARTSCGRSGTRSRPCSARVGCSSSGSRPTPSCATWSGCWSGRCSRWGRAPRPRRLPGAARGRAARARGGDRRGRTASTSPRCATEPVVRAP